MKFEVFNRFSGALQFTAEIDCAENEFNSIKLGLAVKWAYKTGASLDGASLDSASLVGARLDGASLDGASLVGASLVGASLVGARLVGARLVGASLVGASLIGAKLVGASLDGASLDSASLVGARLVGARLDGAICRRGEKLYGPTPIMQLGPIGSRRAWLLVENYQDEPWVAAGCFYGSLTDFTAAVHQTHGDNIHAKNYLTAIELIKVWHQNQK